MQGNLISAYRDLRPFNSGIERHIAPCKGALGWSLFQERVSMFAFGSVKFTRKLKSSQSHVLSYNDSTYSKEIE